MAAASPSTSISTPRESLSTWPSSPASMARRYTWGRNPTPCTVPSIRTPTRTRRAGERSAFVLILAGPGAHFRQHEAVQQVVGGQRAAFERAHLAGLLEAQARRQSQLEAQPYRQPVHRAGPAA